MISFKSSMVIKCSSRGEISAAGIFISVWLVVSPLSPPAKGGRGAGARGELKGLVAGRVGPGLGAGIIVKVGEDNGEGVGAGSVEEDWPGVGAGIIVEGEGAGARGDLWGVGACPEVYWVGVGAGLNTREGACMIVDKGEGACRAALGRTWLVLMPRGGEGACGKELGVVGRRLAPRVGTIGMWSAPGGRGAWRLEEEALSEVDPAFVAKGVGAGAEVVGSVGRARTDGVGPGLMT
jgi:hypothetical protein